MALESHDVAVGVFTSALKLRERALSVQETWLREFPRAYLIGGSHGDPKLRMLTLGHEVGEDYRSAHRKQFLGLLELYRLFPDAKWFFITGCDAFVFAPNLIELLSRFDHREELLVGGHCGLVHVGGEPLLYPSGGPGFALSRPLLAAVAPGIRGFIVEWETEHPELGSACDAALAYFVRRERGVRLSYAEGFYHRPPYRYPGNTYKDGEGRDVNRAVIDRPIAFHNLSIREMYLLQGGVWPRAPGFPAKTFDKLAFFLSRRLRTKAVVNTVCRLIFARGVTLQRKHG